MVLFCVFDSSARNLPFDAKGGSNCLFERLCSFVDYEVRALGDKHRAAMLVIDHDGHAGFALLTIHPAIVGKSDVLHDVVLSI